MHFFFLSLPVFFFYFPQTPGKVSSECQRCGETKEETGVLDPSNHEGPIVTDVAVPATCTSKGRTEGSHCTACGATVVAQTETPINPKNHRRQNKLDRRASD